MSDTPEPGGLSSDRAHPATGAFRGDAHLLPLRVYWEDTDAGGIVYHASYVRFCERGRTEMLRAVGLDQGVLRRESGLLFVVTGMTLKFHAPAIFDDSLLVCTRCTTIRAASIRLHQEVWRDSDRLFDAAVTCAAIGTDGKPRRLGDPVRAALARLAKAMQDGNRSARD